MTRMLAAIGALAGRQLDGERRAHADRARERDLAADQGAERPADVQAQAGPLARTGGRVADLLEGGEDPFLVVGADPGPTVDDLKPGDGAGPRGPAHPQPDLALVGELDRVVREVDEDLLERTPVA